MAKSKQGGVKKKELTQKIKGLMQEALSPQSAAAGAAAAAAGGAKHEEEEGGAMAVE